MPTRIFLERLLQKLKSNDARSIHLNALPSNLARIDIYDFVNIHQSLHLQFLNELLSKQNFKISITIDANVISGKTEDEKKILEKLIKKLNHLYYEDKESEQEHGYHSFGFGYPLLIKKDYTNKEKIIKAPIFIWYLKIERDTRKSNTWIISRNEDLPVVINPVLLTYLESNEKITLSELNNFVDDDLVSEQELLHAVELITEKSGNKQITEPAVATILPCTNKESIDILTKEQAWVRFSGVFGLYKTIKQSIVNDVEAIIQNDNIEKLASATHEINYKDILIPVKLDATQEQILYALQENQKIIIQGPPGTGKSQTLTAIITNALLNRKKVLVVCEKKTALEVLQQNLKHLNLEERSILIEDVYKDRRVVVEKVRTFIEQNKAETERFREHDFEQTKTEFSTLREQANHKIEISQIPFFADDTLVELIIKNEKQKEQIQNQDEVSKLSNLVKNNLFEFNFEEFRMLNDTLKNAELLLQKLPDSITVFDKINSTVFKYAVQDIERLIEEYHLETKTLSDAVELHKNQSTYNITKGWKKIINKVLATFSPQKKALLKKQQYDIIHFHQLAEKWNENALFEKTISPIIPIGKMEECLPELSKIKDDLADIYHQRNYFEAFYQWKNYWLKQDEKTKYLLNIFMQNRFENPLQVFDVWYKDQAILDYVLKHQLTDEDITAYSKLKTSDDDLKNMLGKKINYIWNEIKQKSIEQRDEAALKYLFNLRKNKQYETRNTLRKIVLEDIDFFTDCFPVVFTNPEVCTSVFPAEPYFDLVILDEASQLKIEETYTSLLRGKQHIISGDKHQMPPSNFFGNTVLFFNEGEEHKDETADFLAEAQSLLEFADDAGYKNYYIDYHYRSKHPDLIQFSNHAFYNSRLIPMPAKQEYQAVEYYEINGLYEKGINKEEAKAVAAYIFGLDITQEIPSVGIGTFNLFQRNYIADLIYEQALQDEIKSKHLDALLSKGLFIKNLENIQGDERDIMLLSTTFGADKDGKFRQLFGPLSQEKGYKLLNVIVTRAKQKMLIFSSIPDSYIQQFSEEITAKGNSGKGILYAYLAYAKSISEQNGQQQQFILHQLGQATVVSNTIDNDYVDFVYELLREKYGDSVRKYQMVGGLKLDLVIYENNNIRVWLCLLDNIQNKRESSYRQVLHTKELLFDYKISTIFIHILCIVHKKVTIFDEIDRILAN